MLHVAGDALGSIGVIISGLIVKYVASPYRGLADPLVSLFTIAILFYGAIGPLRSTIAILTQKVPLGVDVAQLERKLRGLAHIVSTHDLHVWQLDEKRLIGSVHLLVSSQARRYYDVLDSAKSVFHKAGIHATTLQLEFVDDDQVLALQAGGGTSRGCFDPLCGERCEAAQCCPHDDLPLLPTASSSVATASPAAASVSPVSASGTGNGNATPLSSASTGASAIVVVSPSANAAGGASVSANGS